MTESVHEPVIDAPMARRIDPNADELSGDERARQTGYKRRFAIIYLALALAVGVGLGGLIVGLADTDTHTGESAQVIPKDWSSYHPEGSTNARASQIAAHVSSRYQHPDGRQLVGAISGPPLVVFNEPEGSTQFLVRAVVIRPTLPTGGTFGNDEIEVVDTSSAVQYVLCGFGEGCSIDSGEPSKARDLLLSREALELALYTFKYLATVNSVVIYMPPRPGGQLPPHVVFLRRSELGAQLAKPLSETLAAEAPGIGEISRAETATLNRLTGRRFYRYVPTPSQDGGAVLLLDPVTAP